MLQSGKLVNLIRVKIGYILQLRGGTLVTIKISHITKCYIWLWDLQVPVNTVWLLNSTKVIELLV